MNIRLLCDARLTDDRCQLCTALFTWKESGLSVNSYTSHTFTQIAAPAITAAGPGSYLTVAATRPPSGQFYGGEAAAIVGYGQPFIITQAPPAWQSSVASARLQLGCGARSGESRLISALALEIQFNPFFIFEILGRLH